MLRRKKKKCPRCGKEIKKEFDFCPNCGVRLKEKDSFGGLIDEEFDEMAGFGGVIGGIMKKLPIKDMIKQISKQMEGFDRAIDEKPKIKRRGISVSIKTINGRPEVKINPIGDIKIKEIERGRNKEKRKKEKIMSKEQEKKLQDLPRKELSSKVRRLANKIIYEMDMPGVKEKDVFVSRLRNSIEIKAIGKKEAYFKLIPISLPIKSYSIKKGIFILELTPES